MNYTLVLLAANAFAQTADFSRDVEPLLRTRCQSCHGAQVQMSGLRLDRAADAARVITPGKSAESRLIRMVSGEDPKRVMPPTGKRLTAEEIAKLKTWIDQGARWPESATVSQTAKHWAFQPIRRAEPPAVRSSWVRNPIDQFIVARLQRENVEPSAESAKTTLLRRVYFDLTGLPPTPRQTAAFLSDNRADAYERVVDQLLESQHYGEKWARQWLDLARYADSDGYEKDYVRPHAWRWRHWVIQALNNDMPFDQFTVEQIAGDLLPDATTDQKVATGFHRNTLTNREGGVNVEQFRMEQVLDRAATVGTVWLGLTFGCAQCHDHKYDPIKQKEFYQLTAFFNNADEEFIDAPLDGEIGPYLRALPEYQRKREELLRSYRVFELMPAWEAKMKEARANPGKWTDWDHAYDAFQKYQDSADRILDTPPGQRSPRQTLSITDHFVINYHRVISKEAWKELKFTELRQKLNALRADFPAISEGPVIQEMARRKSHVLIRGDWKKKGAEVAPGFPAFLHSAPPDPAPSRLALARWLVSKENPLTPRVTVNRYWQEFFGRGLVRTSEDFGAQGEPPTHPELLDWLAAKFVDSGFRVKALHRLIVTSATYRQASNARPDVDSRDPGNTLLARQSRLRLPAELIRDNALSVSELLDTAVGGKSVKPPQPKGVAELAYSNSVKWEESPGRQRYRRGLYIHFQRTVPYPQLMNFDSPDANVAACRRDRSNTALQALNLLNDPVFVEAAQALAARILREKPAVQLADRIQHAFEVSLNRAPAPREREWVAEYYNQQLRLFEQDPKSATALFPVELPGVGRAEAAAWTGVASALLNLDEFITRE